MRKRRRGAHEFLKSDTTPALLLLAAAALAAGPRGILHAEERRPARLPANLAPHAEISADSEYSGEYVARLVADGCVPGALSHDDVGRAWCVKGETHRGGATLTFRWKQPVRIAEIIHYGRTAWFLEECWKECEILAGDASEPACRVSLEMAHGPQRIRLPEPVSTDRLRMRFTNSYGGLNPGASEIQIFAAPVSDRDLERLLGGSATRQAVAGMPKVDRVDPAALEGLIDAMARIHGTGYAGREEHARRLADLRARLADAERERADEDDAESEGAQEDDAESESANEHDAESLERIDALREELASLQREVLLFDVERLLVIRRHEIIASHVYTYHYEGFRPGGGLCIVDARDPSREPLELASSPTGQILECDLSYDGKTVLFSWRRTQGEGYHVWRVDIDGTDLRQLTDGRWHDYNACWLPDGGIAFLSSRAPQFAYCWDAPVGIVHRMNADGSDVRKLSANYLNDFTPYPLDDGRIIYTRWEYVDRPAIPIQSLWTINPDGTCLSVFFGNRVLSPGTFMEARQIPGTSKILCTMTGHNGPTRGAIGIIDPSLGVNAQEAIENITPDVPVPAVNRGDGNTSGSKQYSCPLPLDPVRFLVSIRGPVLVRTLSGDCQSLALPAPAEGMQYFCATPVRPRPRPPVIPSSLAHARDAGAARGEEPHACIFLQDVYDGLEPHVKRGEVDRIRVVRELEKTVRIDPNLRAFGFQFPVISCGATYAGKMVLGEVPVEPDGSAYFRVPAAVPIYFMALDAEGRAIQRMRSFTHLMPGEVQGCVGCHEPRSSTPRARLSLAHGKPPRDLEPPEWGGGGFDYARIVQPVLDRYCVRCHDAVEAPGGVDLSGGRTDYFNVSYDVLARERQGPRGSPYVSWIPTYNGQEQNILEIAPRAWGSPRSRLAEIVLTGHPDGDGNARFEMDAASRRRILAWIDLNVPYYGSSETAHPDARGCRQLYPESLEGVLADVAKRRCAGCHADGKIPRREWIRITEPHLNPFLLAPLDRSAGGSGKCGRGIFASAEDPDYRAILAAFDSVARSLAERPRMDMPGGRAAPTLCRDSQ